MRRNSALMVTCCCHRMLSESSLLAYSTSRKMVVTQARRNLSVVSPGYPSLHDLVLFLACFLRMASILMGHSLSEGALDDVKLGNVGARGTVCPKLVDLLGQVFAQLECSAV